MLVDPVVVDDAGHRRRFGEVRADPRERECTFFGGALPVRARRLSPDEGQYLLRLVRRGRQQSIRVRRGLMILAPSPGTPVPAIARLVAADEETVRDVIHAFNQRGLAALDPSPGGRGARRISDDDVAFIVTTARGRSLTPNDFTSLDQVEDRLTAFELRYNATARPFRWKFTPADLEDLMARIERHEQKEQNLQQPPGCDHQPAALALAAYPPEGLTARTPLTRYANSGVGRRAGRGSTA